MPTVKSKENTGALYTYEPKIFVGPIKRIREQKKLGSIPPYKEIKVRDVVVLVPNGAKDDYADREHDK